MKSRVEGIVERFAPELCGHGDRSFHVLLTGKNTLFYFGSARHAYSALPGRPSNANSALAELMTSGDQISFEITGDPRKLNFFEKSEPGTLRNWTLENRLHGTVKDITPDAPLLDEVVWRLT